MPMPEHNPPLCIRADGWVTPLPMTGGLALAILDGRDYAEAVIDLSAGDSLYFYTNGVTEATDSNNAEFTMQRLMALLHGSMQCPTGIFHNRSSTRSMFLRVALLRLMTLPAWCCVTPVAESNHADPPKGSSVVVSFPTSTLPQPVRNPS